MASRTLAEKMEMRFEGTMRWVRVLPEYMRSDVSLEVKREGDEGLPGRHSDYLSMCWDDWVDGGKEKVQALIDRRV